MRDHVLIRMVDGDECGLTVCVHTPSFSDTIVRVTTSGATSAEDAAEVVFDLSPSAADALANVLREGAAMARAAAVSK